MLCFEKFPVTKAFMDKTGGIKIFRRNFCLIVPKIFVGEFCCVSIIFGVEKPYASEGYLTIFRRLFLSYSFKHIRRGTLLCCVS